MYVHWSTGVCRGTYRGQSTTSKMKLVSFVERKLFKRALLFNLN